MYQMAVADAPYDLAIVGILTPEASKERIVKTSDSLNLLLIKPATTAWSRFCWFVTHSRFSGLLSVFMPFLWLICGSPNGLGMKAKAINRWAKYVTLSIRTRAYPLLFNLFPHRTFSGCGRTTGLPRNDVSYELESLRINPESLASYRSRSPGIFFQIVLSIANYTPFRDTYKRNLPVVQYP